MFSFSLFWVLSPFKVYISYTYRVNENEGDEFGHRKRERERKVRTRAKFTCFIVVMMVDDPKRWMDYSSKREFFVQKNSHPLLLPRGEGFFFRSCNTCLIYIFFLFLSNHRAKIDGDVATVGITDHAQAELGDIVYVELPEVGSAMEATKSFGVVESVKAASDVYSPISGTVIEINEALNDSPGTVNDSPFEGGWLMKVKVSDVPGSLMDAAAYEKSIA